MVSTKMKSMKCVHFYRVQYIAGAKIAKTNGLQQETSLVEIITSGKALLLCDYMNTISTIVGAMGNMLWKKQGRQRDVC